MTKTRIFSAAVSAVLVVATLFAMAIPSFAADITANGGNASTPVKLYTTDDGTLDGDPSATAISVTIPTSLPVAMGTDGTVTTASTVKITNNSYGAVRVKQATVKCSGTWKLTSFGAKSTLASEKVDSNKIGFALKLGAGTQVKTSGTENVQVLISAPSTGCYMSGVGDTSKNSIAVNYDAIVTPVSTAVTDAEVASVEFVVEFDTAA